MAEHDKYDKRELSETVRKLDAIQESTTLVVLFTELLSKAIVTNDNAMQRSILTE